MILRWTIRMMISAWMSFYLNFFMWIVLVMHLVTIHMYIAMMSLLCIASAICLNSSQSCFWIFIGRININCSVGCSIITIRIITCTNTFMIPCFNGLYRTLLNLQVFSMCILCTDCQCADYHRHQHYCKSNLCFHDSRF